MSIREPGTVSVHWLWPAKMAVAIIAFLPFSPNSANAQGRKFITPPNQVIAVRAGRLFDPRSGSMLNNQIILIRGERIADVGPNVQIPREARVIDLSGAWVLPGMIDAHVHLNTDNGPEITAANRAIVALANAQIDLAAGFTTIADMDSRGGFNTVDIRDQIDAGRVQGPRMQVVGQSLNQRAADPYPDPGVRFAVGFTENKNVNSPWLGRAAVREAKLHGVDMVKIYTTQDFAGTIHKWNPDGSQINSPSLTYEEVEAIVDEAHRLGLKVACHAYGGEGMDSCIKAGVDLPNHLLGLDQPEIKIMLEKKLPYVVTVDDLVSLEKGGLADYRWKKQPNSIVGAGIQTSTGCWYPHRVWQRRYV